MELHGNFVSVIDTKDCRIEGVLDNMDLHRSRIVVKNARNFGSEGRRIHGPQIPPSAITLPSVTFRESQIKDLELIFVPSSERDFPSLSPAGRQESNRKGPQRRSYSDAVASKKN